MRIAKNLGAVAALVSAPLLVGCGAASAMPSVAPARTQAPIVLVRDGCGRGFGIGPGGECQPNGGREFVEPRVVEPRVVGPRGYGPREVAPVRLPPPCPRGYVRDPDPARPICYPRF